MEKTIKVLWVCHFSNEMIRKRLKFARPYLINVIRKHMGYPTPGRSDFAVWNTNAVREIEKYPDIELTIVMPHYGIAGKYQSFTIGHVKYVCFRSQDDHIIPFLKRILFHRPEKEFRQNRMFISTIIEEERPDIVHFIGAENPYYSIAALDVSANIPSIISLQTLISIPDFKSKLTQSSTVYQYRTEIEKQVIRKCTYIAGTKSYREYITENIKPDAKYLDMPLALGVDIKSDQTEKEYDFVYFAANIHKACDDAIEAFGLACKKYPNLLLNVSGSYDSDYKKKIDERIRQLGITKNVVFTGSKPSHEEVLQQIRKSRFALLPLKVDLVSSTIREAMACGLPVISTITEGTPVLNIKRQTVLLSEQGNYHVMAENIIRLIEDENLANLLRENGFKRIREIHNNSLHMSKWHDAYMEICN